MLKILSSAAVVIGALRVNVDQSEVTHLTVSQFGKSKTRKDVAKFVVCCSRDWRFKG